MTSATSSEPTLPAWRAMASLARNPATPADELMALGGNDPRIDRILARHESAPPMLLERLSHSSDKPTRQAVIRNANASKEVLLRLAPQFPLAFFKNPAFDWLILEEPNLLASLGHGVLRNILKRPECPDSIMRWAALNGSGREKLATAMNPAASVEVLSLLQDQGGAAAEAARTHAKLHAEGDIDAGVAQFCEAIRAGIGALSEIDARTRWRQGLIGPGQWKWLKPVARLAALRLDPMPYIETWLSNDAADAMATGDLAIWRLAATRSDAAPQTLRDFAECVDEEVRANVAANPMTPVDSLVRLAGDSSDMVRAALVENPACPVDLLCQLAHDPDYLVRSAFQGRKDLPSMVLESLSNHSDLRIRHWTARQVDCAAPTLASLAKDAECEVRAAVAGNSSTPLEWLRTLSEDVDPVVRLEVARNGTTPTLMREQLVEALGKSDHGPSLAWIERSPETLPNLRQLALQSLAGQADVEFRLQAARSGACSAALLAALAADKKDDVRQAVPQHAQAPADVIDRLSQDRRSSVRWAVASRSMGLSDVIIQRLALDVDPSVRRAVGANVATPVCVLDGLANDGEPYVRSAVAANASTSSTTLLRLVHDADRSVVAALVRHPAIPEACFRELASHSEASVRLALAACAGLPDDVIETLAADADGRVRGAVAANARTPLKTLGRLLEMPDLVLSCTGRDLLALPEEQRLALLRFIVKAPAACYGWNLRDELAKDPTTPGDILDAMARRRGMPTPSDLRAAADPGSSIKRLSKLAESSKKAIHFALLANPSFVDPARAALIDAMVDSAGSRDFEDFPDDIDVSAHDRQRARDVVRARRWWHDLNLLARRYGGLRLPVGLDGKALVALFSQQARLVLVDPDSSMISAMIGAPRHHLQSIEPMAVDKAFKLPLFQDPEAATGMRPWRLLAQAHPNARTDALVKSYRSVHWLERLAVARNLAAPPNLLTSLSKDANGMVSSQAQHTVVLDRALKEWQQVVLTCMDPWTRVVLLAGINLVLPEGFAGSYIELRHRVETATVEFGTQLSLADKTWLAGARLSTTATTDAVDPVLGGLPRRFEVFTTTRKGDRWPSTCFRLAAARRESASDDASLVRPNPADHLH